jgi:putative colanic acid biosynthesis glycosyltransferase
MHNRITAQADYYISEPDSGIYQAMNKGLAKAKGNYVWFLNSGDEALEGAVAGLQSTMHADPRPDMVWGQAVYRFIEGDEVVTRPRSAESVWFSGPACHQAILFRRKALPVPCYDERYHLAGDYALVARLLRGGATVATEDRPFCVYLAQGASSRRAVQAMREEVRVRREELGMNGVAAYGLGWAKLGYQLLSGAFPAVKKTFRRRF